MGDRETQEQSFEEVCLLCTGLTAAESGKRQPLCHTRLGKALTFSVDGQRDRLCIISQFDLIPLAFDRSQICFVSVRLKFGGGGIRRTPVAEIDYKLAVQSQQFETGDIAGSALCKVELISLHFFRLDFKLQSEAGPLRHGCRRECDESAVFAIEFHCPGTVVEFDPLGDKQIEMSGTVFPASETH